MKQLKSSTLLKAKAREQLSGKYQTVIFAYVITQLITSTCLSIVELQVNLQALTGIFLYCGVYIIILLLAPVFDAGQNYLYLNIARKKEYTLGNIWYGFRACADRAIWVNLIKTAKCALFGLPLVPAVCLLVFTKNYYFSLLVAAALVFFMVGCTLVYLDYSQALYLLIDYPEASPRELLSHSKSLMVGHRGSLFYLLISFLGMYALSLVSCGLGMLWVYPYVTATRTNYYLELTTK